MPLLTLDGKWDSAAYVGPRGQIGQCCLYGTLEGKLDSAAYEGP